MNNNESSNSARLCVVTGARRGLGLEFVRQLLERGDRVLAGCRHPNQAKELTALASKYPTQLVITALDVTDAASRDALADRLASWNRIDLLINNAGVLVNGERFGSIAELNLRRSFDVNAIAPLMLVQRLASLLEQGRQPVIANISSTLGSIGATGSVQTPSYGISKAALNMVSRMIGLALAGSGVRTVTLHPGWVRTDMGGANAPLAPEQSIRGMLSVIDQLPANSAGNFFDYRGEPLPW